MRASDFLAMGLIVAGCLACCSVSARGQERGWIPAQRLIEWKPGVEGGVPDYPVVTQLRAEDMPADGKTDASRIIQQAIDGAKTPGVVLLPEGTFMLRERLTMRSGVALRGAGLDKTHLIFDVESKGVGAIIIRGQVSTDEIAVEEGTSFGSAKLLLRSTAGIERGTMILLWQEKDRELMVTRPLWDTDWGQRSMGQMLRVTGVDGKTITIDPPLRLDYKEALRPRVVVVRPLTGIGVESLHLKRLDQKDNLITLMYAENCWVRDCELEDAMQAHIRFIATRHVTVENCYIHDAHNHGGGGHGYGVSLSGNASETLIMNNIFHTLRHAMITQTGANGNVFAYNFSFDPFGSDNAQKNWWHSTDISIHGHYTYATLFEGNLVQRAGVADHWGPAGPRMTLFRNRVASPEREFDEAQRKKLGIRSTAMGITAHDHSHMVNLIGNTLTEGRLSVDDTCRDALVEGNLVGGRMVWNQQRPSSLPASLFLKEKPAFWGNKPWPGIGADVDGAGRGTTLPAQDWYTEIKRRGRAMPYSEVGPKVGDAAASRPGRLVPPPGWGADPGTRPGN